jgi:formylglycine-generating enzyme required for sulfatase activity
MSDKSEERQRPQETTRAQTEHKPLTLFYSYAHKDEALRKKLEEHLVVLSRRGLIAAWHDREILAGEDWKGKIDHNLNSADIILLLVSSSFLASDYCSDIEMNRALERHDAGEARVIPIILRPCLWQESPLARLQAVPKDARPVTQWHNTDKAFLDVATALRRVILEFQQKQASLEPLAITEQPEASAGVPAIAEQPKPSATVSPPPVSSNTPLIEPASERRVQVAVDATGLQDLAVFKDIDAPWCPEMVILPAGEFMMGSADADQPSAYSQHRVTINYRFAVGRYPVTFEEYDHFCEATGKWKPHDKDWGRGRRPVINVNWKDANDYCAWLAQQTGKPYRLLSESEWEYACRAGTTTRFAFGDNISTAQARYGLLAWSTVEVGSYQPNLWDLFDMHGNVAEWVADVWSPTNSGSPTDGSPRVDNEAREERVTRNGGFRFIESAGLCSYWRDHAKYMESNDSRGFRVARTL